MLESQNLLKEELEEVMTTNVNDALVSSSEKIIELSEMTSSEIKESAKELKNANLKYRLEIKTKSKKWDKIREAKLYFFIGGFIINLVFITYIAYMTYINIWHG